MRQDTKTEFDCQRCGIHVVCAIPQPGETIWCCVCRFIESIEDPAARGEVAQYLDDNDTRHAG